MEEKGWAKNNLLEKGWTKIQPDGGKGWTKKQPDGGKRLDQKTTF
jgi:hypothetical protein